MNFTNLNSTRMILERVKKHDGLLSWYSIAKYVDQCENAEKNPPVYAVIEQLSKEGLLSSDMPDEVYPKYSITEAGLDLLEKLSLEKSVIEPR
jgi:DNA-binding PadR family transcriptional regulator